MHKISLASLQGEVTQKKLMELLDEDLGAARRSAQAITGEEVPIVLVGHNADVADWPYIYHVCTKNDMDFSKIAEKHGIVGTADTLRLLKGVGKCDVSWGGVCPAGKEQFKTPNALYTADRRKVLQPSDYSCVTLSWYAPSALLA